MFGHDADDQDNQDNQGQLPEPAVTEPVASGSLGDSNDTSPSTDTAATDSTNDPSVSSDSSATAPTVSEPSSSVGTPVVSDELLDIKKQALQQLSPLVGHLEQSPEEKFKTTMMMIQASDDQSLVQAAYEAAKQITDDKTRAQALLDVVNEINYFTQQHNQD